MINNNVLDCKKKASETQVALSTPSYYVPEKEQTQNNLETKQES